MSKAHWWVLAGLAALAVLYVVHQRCPGCQGRWQALGVRFKGGGQAVGQMPQYVVSPN